MTRVSVKVVQNNRKEGTYVCQVFVEGRANIVSGVNYKHDTKGNGTCTVTVTGERLLLTAQY